VFYCSLQTLYTFFFYMVDPKYSTLKLARKTSCDVLSNVYRHFPSKLNISYIASGHTCTIFETRSFQPDTKRILETSFNFCKNTCQLTRKVQQNEIDWVAQFSAGWIQLHCNLTAVSFNLSRSPVITATLQPNKFIQWTIFTNKCTHM
jgi:hypothetical protein